MAMACGDASSVANANIHVSTASPAICRERDEGRGYVYYIYGHDDAGSSIVEMH
jgi:hypothetical protein